jgi:hypothetical protein
MANKLALTSLLAFFPIEWQMPLGMVVIVCYMMAVLLLQPYVRRGDDRLLQLGNLFNNHNNHFTLILVVGKDWY